MRNEKVKLKRFNQMLDYLNQSKTKKIAIQDLRKQFIFNALYFPEMMKEFLVWSKQYKKNFKIVKGNRNSKYLIIG